MKLFCQIFIIIYYIILYKLIKISANSTKDIVNDTATERSVNLNVHKYGVMSEVTNEREVNNVQENAEISVYHNEVFNVNEFLKEFNSDDGYSNTYQTKFTRTQQNEVIYKYAKYIGLVGRCVKKTTSEKARILQCTLTETGVFIYNNLLLTSFAWDIPQLKLLEQRGKLSGHRGKTVAAYMIGGKLYADLYGKDTTNYTAVHYLEDWRSFVNRITGRLSGSFEQLIPTLPFVQLAVLVGHTPLDMNGEKIDYLTIPIHSKILPLNDDEAITDNCFILTYGGPQLIEFSKLMVLPVEILPNKVCKDNSLLSSTIIDPLCIYIDQREKRKAQNFEPRGGEPVICNDELLCIVTNASIYDRYTSLYPCTTVLEHGNWIRKHISHYGLDVPTDEYSKYMGMIVHCYRQSIKPKEYCVINDIGVLIHDNLILTSTSQYSNYIYHKSKKNPELWYAYIAGAKESLDTLGKQRVQYESVVHLEDRLSYHSVYNSHDLTIAVGLKPLILDEDSVDSINLPTKQWNITITDCFLMTYGPTLKASFNSSSIHLHRIPVTIYDKLCTTSNNSKPFRELCIGIDTKSTNIIPRGGEPIICNDTLYGIVTNNTCTNATDYHYFIFTNIFDYMSWITNSVNIHGYKLKSVSRGGRCSCHTIFLIALIIFTYSTIYIKKFM